MKKRLLITAIVITASIFILGYGASALADRGRGFGRGGCGGPGGQWGGGYGASLSAEQQQQLVEQRQSFFNDTAELRQEIYRKDLDLRRELARPEPDAAKARLLRKEMSQLESDFDQKRLDHMMTVRKIAPEAGLRGYGRGGRGSGYGDCPGPGGGPRCW